MAVTRPFEQIKEHYEVEKRLAGELKRASKVDRKTMYTALYDELFKLVPHHPQLKRKTDPERQNLFVADQLQALGPFLRDDLVFVEVGPGDCALSFRICGFASMVYGVDVCNTISDQSQCPENFRLFISDGTAIPVPAATVDLVYSNQLMEHLHPDDALEQLQNIRDCLTPEGTYLCVTPNRLNGPHDISRHFADVAEGFHLKEYSVSELVAMFQAVGFRRVKIVLGAKGRFFVFPVFLSQMTEKLLGLLPVTWRRRLAGFPVIRNLIYPRMAATK